MGYHVKIEELLEIQSSVYNQISEWRIQLAQVQEALGQAAGTTAVQGKMGDSIRNYVTEVHIPLAATLQQMIEEYEMRLSLYADGYYGIDGSYAAEIAQGRLEDQQQQLISEKDAFETVKETIYMALSSVSDIVSISNPDGAAVAEAFETLKEQVVSLNQEVGEYEAGHENDTETINAMIDSMQSILSARTGSGAIPPIQYQKGSIVSVPGYQTLGESLQASADYVERNLGQYQKILDRYNKRWNDKIAEDRKGEGFLEILEGALAVLAGAALLMATAGLAAPIVIGATIIGTTSAVYGLSNFFEGLGNVGLGFMGDGKTQAVNPIRDTLFVNHPELYYTIGNASMIISAIAAPISGAGKAALKAETSVYRAVAVEGGKVLITGAAAGKSSEYVYKQTGSRGLSILTGLGVGALSYGGLHGLDKAANISGVHGKTAITAVKGKGGTEGASGAIPDKAKDIAGKIKANNGTPPQGYKGGKVYQNNPVGSGQKLPDGINYKEYDVNPYIKGQDRGVERIVIGEDGSVWYTNNHYDTFTKLE